MRVVHAALLTRRILPLRRRQHIQRHPALPVRSEWTVPAAITSSAATYANTASIA
jgi:hypothetical protein